MAKYDARHEWNEASTPAANREDDFSVGPDTRQAIIMLPCRGLPGFTPRRYPFARHFPPLSCQLARCLRFRIFRASGVIPL